jgi:hypothetical protein
MNAAQSPLHPRLLPEAMGRPEREDYRVHAQGQQAHLKTRRPCSTGYERDLYGFPELPHDAAQHLEQEFFAYADQKASDSLDNHLGVPVAASRRR